jgi:hypothetical protein
MIWDLSFFGDFLVLINGDGGNFILNRDDYG